jgi:hypothetical protein
MRLTFCVACGDWNSKRIQHHHLIPRSKGGSDDEASPADYPLGRTSCVDGSVC